MAITASGYFGLTLEKQLITTGGESLEAETNNLWLLADAATPNFDTHDFRADHTGLGCGDLRRHRHLSGLDHDHKRDGLGAVHPDRGGRDRQAGLPPRLRDRRIHCQWHVRHPVECLGARDLRLHTLT